MSGTTALTTGLGAFNSRKTTEAVDRLAGVTQAGDGAVVDAIHELTQAVRTAEERQYARDRMLYDLLAGFLKRPE